MAAQPDAAAVEAQLVAQVGAHGAEGNGPGEAPEGFPGEGVEAPEEAPWGAEGGPEGAGGRVGNPAGVREGEREGAVSMEEVDRPVELWVHRVVHFSSQYNNTGWAANSVIGEPRVYPRYGDIIGAWAQHDVTDHEFIVVEYCEPLYLAAVDIYETLNAGALVSLCGLHLGTGVWEPLWTSPTGPQVIQASRIFSPPLAVQNFHTSQLKLVLDCTAAGSWCEIDAVRPCSVDWSVAACAPPLSGLAHNLAQLVDNAELFSDVTLVVEGCQVVAHRAVLAARSQYFRAMFCDGLREGRGEYNQFIRIEDVSHAGFLFMLQFLYTNAFTSPPSPLQLNELIRMGDRFSLEGLHTLSLVSLSPLLAVDNVVDLYTDAVLHLPRLDEVERLCMRYTAHNLRHVTRHASFAALPPSLMLDLIQGATAALTLTP